MVAVAEKGERYTDRAALRLIPPWREGRRNEKRVSPSRLDRQEWCEETVTSGKLQRGDGYLVVQ